MAVAAGLAPWAIGTDTGGSVRLPAAWCGLAGLKTTIGRISTYGVLPLAATLDTPGPLARDVEDAALLLAVLQGEDSRDIRTRGVVDIDPVANLKRGASGFRVAVMPRQEREGVDPEILASFDASLDVLANLGAEVVQLASLPLSFAEFAERTGTIIYAEGYSVVGDLCDQADLPLDEDVRPRILAGKRVSARQYLDALAEMGRIASQFAAALEAFDVLATPTIGTPAMPLRSAATGFLVQVNGVEGQRNGLLYFGTNGAQSNPWVNGTSYQCVVPPVRRTPTQGSGGTSGACDGTFALNFNAWMAANPGKAPEPAATTRMQAWFRDPASTSNRPTSLSDGLVFTVCP